MARLGPYWSYTPSLDTYQVAHEIHVRAGLAYPTFLLKCRLLGEVLQSPLSEEEPKNI